MEQLKVLAIDLAKASFQIHGVDERGKTLLKKSLKREQLLPLISQLKPTIIAMESCASAHYWSWQFKKHGHTPRQIAPQYVKPFVKTNKNDAADAEAIAEAAQRPTMRFVPVKTQFQIDLQQLHRVRARLIKQRTSLVNEMRGFLFEYGVVIRQGIAPLRNAVIELMRNPPEELSPACQQTIVELMDELSCLQQRITSTEKRLEEFADTNETCKRLQTIPGVGLVTATAIIAATPDPKAYKNGRHFAASLGLVPRHSGTGGAHNNRTGRISKRGDKYIRSLLVHGARSVMRKIEKRDDPGARWIARLKESKGWNKTAVAVANKNARMMWALLNSDEAFDAKKMSMMKAA